MQLTRMFGVLGATAAILTSTVFQAQAIDLTGTWRDRTSSCKELLPNGQVIVYPNNSVGFVDMYVAQSSEDLRVDQGSFNYDGLVYENATTKKGKGVIQKCIPDAFPEDTVTFHIKDVKTFAPNSQGVSGRMKTAVIHSRKNGLGTGFFEECNVVWERVSQTNPYPPVGCNN
jgi:hypothetical protein